MSAIQFEAVWAILGMADSKLREKIKFAHVFGRDGDAVLLQTTDDEVYTYGNDVNKYGILGQGQGVYNVLKPTEIEVLREKGVQTISSGSAGFVVAATSDSKIYTWGYGGDITYSRSDRTLGVQVTRGQSWGYGEDITGGNGGNAHAVFVPTAIDANLGEDRVSKIACGQAHTVILTDKGQVFSLCMYNNGQWGQSVDTARPELISATLDGKIVSDIACSRGMSFALLDNGELYTWKYGTEGKPTEPRRMISLENIVIKQIVCGQHHLLALTEAGGIFSFGRNERGQLGNGSTANSISKAICISGEYGRFSQVAATHYSNLSAALSVTGIVYVWGNVRSQAVTTPMKTELSSLDDAFVCYSVPAVSWRPLSIVTAIPHSYKNEVLVSLKNSLSEDEEMKDVTFLVEDKKIRAHKTILMIRSGYFRNMFEKEWAESKKEGIPIPDFSYDGFTAFIEYVYTGTLNVNLKFDVLVDLLQIADCYLEEKLKTMCEQTLRDQIQVDNCAYLFVIAKKYQAKVLEAACAQFGAHNMTAVSNTDHFKQMSDPTIFREFIEKVGQCGAFKF